MNQLEHINSARRAVELFRTVEDALDYRDVALTVEQQAKRKGLLALQNKAAESRLWTERHMGEMLREMEMNKGAEGTDSNQYSEVRLPEVTAPKLGEMGLSKRQSSNFQKIATIDEARFIEHLARICSTDDGELSTSGVLLLAGVNVAYVGNSRGVHEWFTPPAFAEAAREVLGGIDLDPASTLEANSIIKAKRIYTCEDDGLAQAWRGRVFMNPPYSQPLIKHFCEKLCQHYDIGEVEAAVVLVNNATETVWFQRIGRMATAICFPSGRLVFVDANAELALNSKHPMQGQAVLYLGSQRDRFIARFDIFGLIL